MLLVVLSVFGARSRCLWFIEAAKATKRFVECSLRTGGGMEGHRAARRHFGASRYSCVNGGLLYRLIEGPDGSSETARPPPLYLLDHRRGCGSTGYRTNA